MNSPTNSQPTSTSSSNTQSTQVESSKKPWETPAFVEESTDVTLGGATNQRTIDDPFYFT